MKRLDDGKVSLVEFLRSIRSTHRSRSKDHGDCSTRFAGLRPRARTDQNTNPEAEELTLVRSYN